ncbi:helix-turn-helix domain-containing protein [Pseudonocardia alni]|uniref:helix-turn-helix domain-containing protein n=1 Tax=Pseudonocardia alni TaxID=33907 RepID=UPI00357151A0
MSEGYRRSRRATYPRWTRAQPRDADTPTLLKHALSSFRAAAEQLNMTQSPVSRQIQRLRPAG